jgi:hypothetical protein
VVALVVAWLVVLVPMIVRKRQEIARTADSALAARVVRKGSARAGAEEDAMRETEDPEPEPAEDHEADSVTETAEALDTADEPDHREQVDADRLADTTEPRRYRPGRGGFDPEAAALAARARYAARQRMVLAMLLLAVISAVVAAVAYPLVWWAHGAIDISLVGYLGYLRRQVRIEEEIRERRFARMAQARRSRPATPPVEYEREEHHEPVAKPPPQPRVTYPNAVVVDLDDEDPVFVELEDPNSLPYRRAVGE